MPHTRTKRTIRESAYTDPCPSMTTRTATAPGAPRPVPGAGAVVDRAATLGASSSAQPTWVARGSVRPPSGPFHFFAALTTLAEGRPWLPETA